MELSRIVHPSVLLLVSLLGVVLGFKIQVYNSDSHTESFILERKDSATQLSVTRAGVHDVALLLRGNLMFATSINSAMILHGSSTLLLGPKSDYGSIDMSGCNTIMLVDMGPYQEAQSYYQKLTESLAITWDPIQALVNVGKIAGGLRDKVFFVAIIHLDPLTIFPRCVRYSSQTVAAASLVLPEALELVDGLLVHQRRWDITMRPLPNEIPAFNPYTPWSGPKIYTVTTVFGSQALTDQSQNAHHGHLFFITSRLNEPYWRLDMCIEHGHERSYPPHNYYVHLRQGSWDYGQLVLVNFEAQLMATWNGSRYTLLVADADKVHMGTSSTVNHLFTRGSLVAFFYSLSGANRGAPRQRRGCIAAMAATAHMLPDHSASMVDFLIRTCQPRQCKKVGYFVTNVGECPHDVRGEPSADASVCGEYFRLLDMLVPDLLNTGISRQRSQLPDVLLQVPLNMIIEQ